MISKSYINLQAINAGAGNAISAGPCVSIQISITGSQNADAVVPRIGALTSIELMALSRRNSLVIVPDIRFRIGGVRSV